MRPGYAPEALSTTERPELVSSAAGLASTVAAESHGEFGIAGAVRARERENEDAGHTHSVRGVGRPTTVGLTRSGE